MMDISSPLIVAAVLLLVIFVWIKAAAAPQDLPLPLDDLLPGEDNSNICPPEFVHKIFASEDLEFIARLNSPYFMKLFRRERNAVALLWVHQISVSVRRIMAQHLEKSRQSQDLEFATEARIFFQYAQLNLGCVLLSFFIKWVGPQKVRGIALYIGQLSERLGQAQREFESATQAPEIGSVGSV